MPKRKIQVNKRQRAKLAARAGQVGAAQVADETGYAVETVRKWMRANDVSGLRSGSGSKGSSMTHEDMLAAIAAGRESSSLLTPEELKRGTPPEVLEKMIEGKDKEFLRRYAQNPNPPTPPEVLEKMTRDTDR